MSEAANFVFQLIFVRNSVKHKFFPVSIVKLKIKFKTIIKNPSYPYLKFLDMVCYEHNINLMTLVMNRITFYGPPDGFIQTLRCYYFSNI